MARKPQTQIEAATYARPLGGPLLALNGVLPDFPISDEPGWQSNGGPTRGHPARSCPFTLECSIPDDFETLVRVHLLGVFALYADRAIESPGTLGASLQLYQDRELTFRQDLLNGRHYFDGREADKGAYLVGDGTSLETIGTTTVGGIDVRVDILTVDVPPGTLANVLRFKDLGSPASFILFDVFFEAESGPGCPFGSRAGGISLAELGAIVRVGDRQRFTKAVGQLERSLHVTVDLDEARGEALTFLAVLTAGALERGGERRMHREQLEAARELDALNTIDEVAHVTRRRVEQLATLVFQDAQGPSSHLIDKALSIVERNYAKEISDASISDQLGLSTSHFRFLFRQTTGQPFHKYLVAMRLEKARQLLIEGDMPVGDVARAVGFTGLSHFSRAFAQRFNVSPTSVRRGTV